MYSFLPSGIENGFPLGLDPEKRELDPESRLLPVEVSKPKKHAEKFREANLLCAEKENSRGHCSQRMPLEEAVKVLGQPVQISPFRHVERTGKELRHVRDFSFPYASSSSPTPSSLLSSSINSRISLIDEKPRTFWAGPSSFAEDVLSLPSDVEVLVLVDDAKSAYRQVPVAREDWPYLVFEVEGGVHLDYFLAMGLSSATDIWGRLADVMRLGAQSVLREEFLRRGGDVLFWRNWVDDFILTAVIRGGLSKEEATRLADEFYARLGVELSREKRREWSSIAVFQGFVWLLKEKVVGVPETKRRKAIERVRFFKELDTVDYLEITTLTGYLSHLAFAIPDASFHLAPFFAFQAPFLQYPYIRKRPTPSLTTALEWWLERLGPDEDLPPASPSSPFPFLHRKLASPLSTSPIHIFSDACDSGIGVVVENEQQFWSLSKDWKSRSSGIHIPEAAALELALHSAFEAHRLERQVLIAEVDNEVVRMSWEKRRSSDAKLNLTLERIAALVEARECRLKVLYLPSAENPADPVSRGKAPENGLKAVRRSWIYTKPPEALHELVVFDSNEK
ncbi:hypothetical protein JCM10213_004724 [Rhodosporidiobolus nylandii]